MEQLGRLKSKVAVVILFKDKSVHVVVATSSDLSSSLQGAELLFSLSFSTSCVEQIFSHLKMYDHVHTLISDPTRGRHVRSQLSHTHGDIEC